MLWSIIYYQHVETFLDSHSREKCVYKGKCVSILIKGKHNTWLARRLTTYKYENENARLDKNLHQFFFFILVHCNNSTLHLYRPSYSISAIKIEIVPFWQVIFKSKDSSENIRGFFFIHLGKKKNMCVYCHMSKKSRVGRSALIFFFYYRQNRK